MYAICITIHALSLDITSAVSVYFEDFFYYRETSQTFYSSEAKFVIN